MRRLVRLARQLITSARLWRHAPNLVRGRNLTLSRGARIYSYGVGSVRLGDNVYVDTGALVYGVEGPVTIGSNTSINPYALLYDPLEIGSDVLIAAHCVIIGRNHVFADVTTPIAKQGQSAALVRIEDDVWLGAHVIVTKGVTIGRGSVIGAGSVVTKSIPPFSVAVGVPAQVISSRRSASRG
jgi:acetyltransferase-like isoleucine patch superfamily enzyme